MFKSPGFTSQHEPNPSKLDHIFSRSPASSDPDSAEVRVCMPVTAAVQKEEDLPKQFKAVPTV